VTPSSDPFLKFAELLAEWLAATSKQGDEMARRIRQRIEKRQSVQ